MFFGKRKRKSSLAARVRKLARKVAKKQKISNLKAQEASLRAKLAKF